MDDATSDRVGGQDLVRWTSCAVVAVAAHGLLAVAVLARPDEMLDPGSPVVMVELAPIAAAPSQTPSDQPPAPQVQMESEQRVQEDVEQKQKLPEEQVEETHVPNPEVTLPQKVPEPPKQEQEAKVEEQAQDESHAAAPPGAPVTAALPAAPAPGHDEERSAVAIATWDRALSARIEAVKRYPVHAHGQRGIARVEFRLDRNGRVLTSRITRSSGSAALDEDALATLKRAEPLPTPPSSISDEMLTIETTIRYKLPTDR
ncbi:MAG: energy transducer TonB [Bradyrhizobiaceae bacterium]|nr:energy transducer TonB [Bradyrhizobiaceae bacterium]